jgi:hypothetical protein
MIFIGAGLSNRDDHFYTNIISSYESDYEVIDLLLCRDWSSLNEAIQKIIVNNKIKNKIVVYNPYTNDEFILNFRKYYPEWIVYSIFSDDEWRHFDYDRYVAMYSNCSSIAFAKNLDLYRKYNIPAIHLPVCCNPQNFFPIKDTAKIYDVTFVGAAYGPRVGFIKFLIKSGVNIKVFGRGWEKDNETKSAWGGWISNEQMNFVINSSKISLNFSWVSADPNILQIKGRLMELAGAKVFQIINDNPDLSEYGFIDELNIATFKNKEHLLCKIKFYLSNAALRESIATNAYELVLNNFVWKERLSSFFESDYQYSFNKINIDKKILVIKRHELIKHSINKNCDEFNSNITIINKKDFSDNFFNRYDYYIYLDYDSDINNETIKMMSFALLHDSTAKVAASFYTSNNWIRLNSNKSIRGFYHNKLLPDVAIMNKVKCIKSNCFDFSYIEVPTFTATLPYSYSRLLIFFFGYSEQVIKSYIQKRISFISMVSKILDKLFQGVLYR